MPLILDATGLQTQGIAEIKSELETKFRDTFGENVNVTPNSVFGQQIGIHAEREALVQAQILAVYNSLDPDNATGVTLDQRSALTGTFRKPATKSKSASFQVNGTDTTIIDNGKRIELLQTQEVWVVVDGPYEIGDVTTGLVQVTCEAEETGPKVFQTTPTTGWSILTPVAGWDSVETTADIDPEDTGSDVEGEGLLRQRRIDELLFQGNDIDAIRAAVGAVLGVVAVAVFDNTSCVAPLDGIPPGAFEVVVDGGVDADIAVAIFSNKPPGAESFGSSGPFPQTTSEGQIIDIFLTRPTDIDIDVEINATSTGAEFPFPVNGDALIAAAALIAFNTDADIGRDIFPPKYVSVVFVAVKDADGNDTIITAEVLMRTGIDPFATTPIVISLRERADFDSANITVTVI